MNKIRPLLLRDNRHSQIIFTTMIISLFMIVGPVALYVKAALAGLAVLIFLTMFIILIFVKYTDKTCPRYVEFSKDSLRFIYWDRHEETIQFKNIQLVEIGGLVLKSFDGIIKIRTAQKVFNVKTEIFDNVSLLVKLLDDKAKITYSSDYMKNVVESALNASDFSKNLRLFFVYGVVLIFLTMAVFINLQLSSLIK